MYRIKDTHDSPETGSDNQCLPSSDVIEVRQSTGDTELLKDTTGLTDGGWWPGDDTV